MAHIACVQIVVLDPKIAHSVINCLPWWETAVAATVRRFVFLALVGMA